MRDKTESEKWKKIFASILKIVFSYYNLRDAEFSSEYGCDISAPRNWKTARCFPNRELFEKLKKYVLESANKSKKEDVYLLTEIEKVFSEFGHGTDYLGLKYGNMDNGEFAVNVLQFCLDAGKGNITLPIEKDVKYKPTGKTQAVVFDFDGTLTKSGKVAKTTWENIWLSLGYDVKECQELHKKFDRKEITHDEWCKITEQKFKTRNLHRESIKVISKKLHLIKGVKQIFQELCKHDIKIYIVSGSVMLVIKSVLGSLSQYVDGIKANELKFNEAGYLTEIVGTKYDFEGKANYILQIAEELKISPKDILFVGNSRNDHFVYKSGARTLCINPQLTDMMNTMIWHDYIETCNDLTEILKYI